MDKIEIGAPSRDAAVHAPQSFQEDQTLDKSRFAAFHDLVARDWLQGRVGRRGIVVGQLVVYEREPER